MKRTKKEVLARRVFISRDLRADSPFSQELGAAGYEVYGRSLVSFSAVQFALPPMADWVFCYSSRSAEFFLQGLAQLDIPPTRYAHYAALGTGTARQLEALGIVPAFVGSGEPKATAAAFLEQAAGQRVLFPRAEQSRQSIQRLLKGKLDMVDLIVYQNRMIREARLPDTDFVVLTSPLNARAYALVKGFSKQQRVVAIGNTTAAALAQLDIEGFRLAERASEAALAAAVLNWEKL